MRIDRVCAAAAATIVLSAMTGCSGTPSVDGDAPESVQREALESSWDKYSEDDRRGLCESYEVDSVGTIAEFENNDFDYDVVKSWLDGKC